MSEYYFTVSPVVEAEGRARRFTIRGVEHVVVTASGVPSTDCLDKGTQVLSDHVPDSPKTGTFLNLGCDWGPITLALVGAVPGATVLATDVNECSLALAARNVAAAGLDNVHTSQAEVLLAELCQTSTPVDLIWSNPSVRISKDVLHELLLLWLALLSADGEAWLMVPKNLEADSLAIWLSNQGWDVNRMVPLKGLRVLRVCRRHGQHAVGPRPDGAYPITGVIASPGVG